MANPSPEITFRVNLELNSTELLGPKTNSRSPSILHPDRHDNDQDRAVSNMANHKDLRSTWIPGLSAANNRALKDGDTFTEYGLTALYIKNRYTTGDNPLLEVVE